LNLGFIVGGQVISKGSVGFDNKGNVIGLVLDSSVYKHKILVHGGLECDELIFQS